MWFFDLVFAIIDGFASDALANRIRKRRAAKRGEPSPTPREAPTLTRAGWLGLAASAVGCGTILIALDTHPIWWLVWVGVGAAVALGAIALSDAFAPSALERCNESHRLHTGPRAQH
jgi:hypothetical protein